MAGFVIWIGVEWMVDGGWCDAKAKRLSSCRPLFETNRQQNWL